MTSKFIIINNWGWRNKLIGEKSLKNPNQGKPIELFSETEPCKIVNDKVKESPFCHLCQRWAQDKRNNEKRLDKLEKYVNQHPPLSKKGHYGQRIGSSKRKHSDNGNRENHVKRFKPNSGWNFPRKWTK